MEGSANNFGTLDIKLEAADNFDSDDNLLDEDAESVMDSLIQRIKTEHAECEETDAESAGLGNIVAEIVNDVGLSGIDVEELKVEIENEEEDMMVGNEEENNMEEGNGYGMVENYKKIYGMVGENGMGEENNGQGVEYVEKNPDQAEDDIEKEEEYDEDGTYTCALCEQTVAGGSAVKKHLLEHICTRSYECLECDLMFTSDCLKDKHTLIQFEMIGETLQGKLYRYFSSSQLLQKEKSDEKEENSNTEENQDKKENTDTKDDHNKKEISENSDKEKDSENLDKKENSDTKQSSDEKENCDKKETLGESENTDRKENTGEQGDSDIKENSDKKETSYERENTDKIENSCEQENSDKKKESEKLQNGSPMETEQLQTDGQSELRKRLSEPPESITRLHEKILMSVTMGSHSGPIVEETVPVMFVPASLEVKTNIPYASKRPFVCLECQKGFFKIEDLIAHSILIHNKTHNNMHLYVCPHCNMGFAKDRQLKNHLKTYESNGCEVHICMSCNKVYRKREPMRTHMYKHTGRGSFECKHCKKTWKNRSVLKRHMESHRTEKTFVCAVCEKYFSTANSLKIHMYIHTGERSFPCTICNKVYSEKRFLRVHMCTHTGEGNYICKICSKAFYSSSQLKLHMCKHTGERPHVCKICNESFLVRNSLLRHMYRHNGEKPYSCITCNKRFVLKQDLTEHLKTHAVRTHVCKLCKRGFTTGAYLNRHMKQHQKKTAGGRHTCVECGLFFMTVERLKQHQDLIHRSAGADDADNPENETDYEVSEFVIVKQETDTPNVFV